MTHSLSSAIERLLPTPGERVTGPVVVRLVLALAVATVAGCSGGGGGGGGGS